MSIKETLNRVKTPINKEGYGIIAISSFITLVFIMISAFLGMLGVIFTCYCIYFFRDPERVMPDGKDNVIAPADGIVDFIGECTPPEELNCNKDIIYNRISIFLNIFDVHVQRIPISGKIKALHYREGKFVNVSNDKESLDNERQSCLIETSSGMEVPVIQIAGLIARRIVCDLKLNQEVNIGDRYGIIRFGSRVDVYLPKEIKINVKVGQRSIGGESVIANLSIFNKSSKK